jgi:hypothetical protein
MLPRTYKNLGVIMVQLKKRKSNKHSEIVSSVRIDVIRQAVSILAKSEAFREANIQINLQDLQTSISQTFVSATNIMGFHRRYNNTSQLY